MRTIIEANGGDGNAVKQNIDTDFRKGVVWWRERRAGEWKNGSMQLMGQALEYKALFDQLCSEE